MVGLKRLRMTKSVLEINVANIKVIPRGRVGLIRFLRVVVDGLVRLKGWYFLTKNHWEVAAKIPPTR